MGKIRIYEWAKQNGKRSTDIVKTLQQHGHKVRNHTSSIEEDILNALFRDEVGTISEIKVEKKPTTRRPSEKKKVVSLQIKNHREPLIIKNLNHVVIK